STRTATPISPAIPPSTRAAPRRRLIWHKSAAPVHTEAMAVLTTIAMPLPCQSVSTGIRNTHPASVTSPAKTAYSASAVTARRVSAGLGALSCTDEFTGNLHSRSASTSAERLGYAPALAGYDNEEQPFIAD